MSPGELRSTRGRRSWLPMALILLVTGGVYFSKLSSAPVYLGGDEAQFGTHAYSIASTGRDLDGRLMPLFFRMEELNWWYQPTLFYLIALTLKVVPLSEGAIRIPTVAIGLLDVLLFYAVVRRLLPGKWYAPLGALMLALTPAHFIFSREARDFICVLPYLLGWLWCFLTFMETDQVGLAVLAGLLLRLGLYGHIAAWVAMPMYLLLTWTALAVARKKPQLAFGVAVGFALPLLPLFVWLRAHPEMVGSMLSGYRVYDARHLSPLQGVKDFLNYNNVQERISVYWDYFNPAYLFFSGGSSLAVATRRAGVFLMSAAVFLTCGIYDLWTKRRSHVGLVVLAGLATAPMGATLVDDRYAIQRELVVIPFGVLVSMFGVALLWRQTGRLVRAATVLLLLSGPIQFAYFYRDYLTDYQIRSAFWFDPANFRDVAQYLMATPAGTVPAVYLSNVIDDAIPRWRFYLMKHDRQDLWPRTHFFSKENLDVSSLPSGSLLALYANDPQLPDLVGPGKCCVIVHRVRDVTGSNSAVILQKNPPAETRR